ncbi:DoxX family protein [Thermostaphylospora chromogena]|uniref:DoxX-like family protein n=1 Tax=Thermostaphylospora chromogena TaxID=35622 RepID=A0A1H1CQZ0_9ACTN|nr:DoxX family protein [Thermostaphylospora chromogena]SDQ66691.1 DoxX-like family protein [Thermostaphylospora chromogena]
MHTAANVLSVILAISFLGSGSMKVLGQVKIMEGLNKLGVSRNFGRVIGALESTAACGLLIGLIVGWLGAAAAVGLVLLMAGAIVFHVRAGDYADPRLRGPAMMPVFLLLFSVVTAILRILAIR